MFFQKKIIITILKYQIRNLSFTTPIILLPTLFVIYNYELNILIMPFLLTQLSFINPSIYYGIPVLFRNYFHFGYFKRTMIFSVASLIWFNLFYFLGMFFFKKNIFVELFQDLKEFEIMLISSIITGSILNNFILKDNNKTIYKNIICVSIFSFSTFFIYFQIHY